MNFGVTEILFAVVAAIVAYLGFTTGRKVERPRAIQEGRDQAIREVQTQTTEQALERVTNAAAARGAVERTPDAELSDQAHRDPNNRIGGV